jgi:hypothetical protein
VDGVTVTKDLFSALSDAVIDVPLIIQTMLCEMDTFEPNKTVYDMTAAQYETFVVDHFDTHGWPAGSGNIINAMYTDQLAQSTELAYQQWIAEYSFMCGNVQVAIKAAESFQSPIYLSLIARGPDHPLYLLPLEAPAKFAGHMWDYIAATQAWDWFHICALTPRYEPTAGDIAFGQVLLAQWLSFATELKLPSSSGIQPVNSTATFPRTYALAFQNGTQPQMVESYGSERCNAFMQAPLNLNQSFWLTN